jgi:hypothetical protein
VTALQKICFDFCEKQQVIHFEFSTLDLVHIQLPNQGLQRLSRLGREADHSFPPSAKINNEWNSTSAPPVDLHEALRRNVNFIGRAVAEKQSL